MALPGNYSSSGDGRSNLANVWGYGGEGAFSQIYCVELILLVVHMVGCQETWVLQGTVFPKMFNYIISSEPCASRT